MIIRNNKRSGEKRTVMLKQEQSLWLIIRNSLQDKVLPQTKGNACVVLQVLFALRSNQVSELFAIMADPRFI
jgi:hypothetical protein